MPESASETAHPPDPELRREQQHLAESRRQLARMRERTASMDAGAAADWVSREFLESTFALRMKQLADDPTVPLFFGRLDYGAGHLGGEHAGESFHIGRRHVTGPDGDALVVDWRAPVSTPFYRASSAEPMGVDLRRRYGFSRGELTGFEDEPLTGGGGPEHSAILEAEIERPRVGPMRDIVATIQPEQDVIVRADLARSICVQGAPGTGKTAVGLHRAAYLLYAHREQLSRQGVLVVGPNASFLRYIRDVLPALGEVEATQATIEELVTAPLPEGRRVRAVEPDDVATLKGAHRVLLRMEAGGESPDDRVQDAVARSAPVKACVRALWPAVDPAKLLHRLLSDPDALASAADGLLDPDEQRLLLWDRPPRSAGTARWTLADAVLLDELRDLLERTGSVGHLVADEAQDLSPMMLRALARRSSTGSVTVLGDLAQATTPWGARSWEEALAHLGRPDAHVEQLTRGFRVPSEVIEYAAGLLPHVAPSLVPPTSVRRTRGDLEVARVPDPVATLADRLRGVLAREGSVGVVVPDHVVAATSRVLDAVDHRVLGAQTAEAEQEWETRVEVVPASLAKGLEFDHVVLLEPAAVVAGEHDRVTGLRRLYVCLTRAVTSLLVLHAEDLPAELGKP